MAGRVSDSLNIGQGTNNNMYLIIYIDYSLLPFPFDCSSDNYYAEFKHAPMIVYKLCMYILILDVAITYTYLCM